MHPILEMVVSNALVATLLAVVAAAVSQVVRRPALTHSLWLLVLLKLVTPPLVPVQLPWSLTSAAEKPAAGLAERSANWERTVDAVEPEELALLGEFVDEPEFQPTDLPSLVEEKPAELMTPLPASAAAFSLDWLFWLWPAGSLVWLGWTPSTTLRFHGLLRHARPASAELQHQANELAKKLGLAASPGIWLVPGVVSPMIWALGRTPRLILPTKLLERLDREQVAALLLHELAHVRRRDHWVRLLEIVAVAGFWWHPVVWWARRELHEAEEQCCDAWVVWALAGAERAYALALLQTAAFFSHARLPLPIAASGIGQVPHLRRRLTMILQAQTPRSLSWAGCLVVFGLGLFLLPLVPVQAQAPKDPFVQAPAEKESVDQQIETLKKAIMILEKQKQAEKFAKPEEKKVDPAELEKAKHEVDQLTKLLELKRQELNTLQAKHQQALARLAALQGWKVQFDNKSLHLDKLQYDLQRYQNFKPIEVQMELLKSQVVDPKMLKDFIKTKVDPNVRQREDKKPAESLEQKLDRLMKEIEDLRKEIRKDKPSAYYQPVK